MKKIAGMDIIFERTRDDVASEQNLPSVLLVAGGAMAAGARTAAQRLAQTGIPVTVVDPGWVLPIDPALVDLVGQFDVAVSVEDGLAVGGVGSELSRLSVRDGGPAVLAIGAPREFLPLATRALLLKKYGMDDDGIFATVSTAVSSFETAQDRAPNRM